jgi:hypothetical protein
MSRGEHEADATAQIATGLRALGPEEFAREAERFLAGLADGERGLLASALVGAYDAPEGESGAGLARLRLDSTDPSLMSRGDVALLLIDLHARDGAALQAHSARWENAPRCAPPSAGSSRPPAAVPIRVPSGGDPTIEEQEPDRSRPG